MPIYCHHRPDVYSAGEHVFEVHLEQCLLCGVSREDAEEYAWLTPCKER